MTLGSHLGHRKDEIATEIRALAQEYDDWVFHFTDGDSSAVGAEKAGNFHRYPFISYDLYLSRYEVVIHHGGSGILYHCLKHGIPAVVIPIDFDQFDNAARLVWAGVAVCADSVKDLPRAFRLVLEKMSKVTEGESFTDLMAESDSGELVRRAIREKFGEAD